MNYNDDDGYTEDEMAFDEAMLDETETIGAVLGGMIAFDQGLYNSLLDGIIDDYISLIRKMDRLVATFLANNDSLKMESLIERNVPYFILAGEAQYKIEHLEGLKMGSRT